MRLRLETLNVVFLDMLEMDISLVFLQQYGLSSVPTVADDSHELYHFESMIQNHCGCYFRNRC